MVNKMGSKNEGKSKGGDNRGQRRKTTEDGSEPSETDEDKVGWMEDRSELSRGGTKAGKMEEGELGTDRLLLM